MYSTYNEGKSVVAERFIRTFLKKIKHMTAIQQNIYSDVLDDIVDKYNNTVYKKSYGWLYAKYNEIAKKKDPKFKVSDIVRISKYKNIFAKGYTLNWSEEVFIINKIKNTVP